MMKSGEHILWDVHVQTIEARVREEYVRRFLAALRQATDAFGRFAEAWR